MVGGHNNRLENLELKVKEAKYNKHIQHKACLSYRGSGGMPQRKLDAVRLNFRLYLTEI